MRQYLFHIDKNDSCQLRKLFCWENKLIMWKSMSKWVIRPNARTTAKTKYGQHPIGLFRQGHMYAVEHNTIVVNNKNTFYIFLK